MVPPTWTLIVVLLQAALNTPELATATATGPTFLATGEPGALEVSEDPTAGADPTPDAFESSPGPVLPEGSQTSTLPLPGDAPSETAHTGHSSGDIRTSTPKATAPASVPASPSSPWTDAGRTGGHQRGGSFSARPLALASSLSHSGAVTPAGLVKRDDSPPKVELRRTWSIGTWIPQLGRAPDGSRGGRGSGDGDDEQVGLIRSATSR